MAQQNCSRPKDSWACGPPKLMKNASVQQLRSMNRCPFPVIPRGCDFFLISRKRGCLSTSPTAPPTALALGNGPLLSAALSFLSSRAKPRDLQFRGPFLDMFFDRAQRSGEICGFFSVLTQTLFFSTEVYLPAVYTAAPDSAPPWSHPDGKSA
jgi:hypothetical protein